ncbi:hypothetical protein ACJRO7_027845 [Eucalyptus globulus]|uniref:Expansin-like EG45 domain-containing protein n=1 Tax=Eucalyptus globulus TaxID=34317 RepID=A0ABD3JTC6_EUCGL
MSIRSSLSAQILPCLLLACVLSEVLFVARGDDVGTAAHYSPPYYPTECYGGDPSQFPSSGLFAAVGDQLWDNGIACGRQYLLECINGMQCIPGRTILITVVDYTLTSTSAAAAYKQSVTGAPFALSETAFRAIAHLFVDGITIRYRQV